MGIEEDWISFLQKNPHFYELTKGDLFIQFLESLSESAKSFTDLKEAFPWIEEKDLRLVMDAFLELRTVSKIKAGSKVFYSTTPEGEKLLAQYRKTKRFYST